MAQDDPDEEAGRMTSAVWTVVETLGVPDTPMRRVYFELAQIMSTSNARELALASAAFLALDRELRDVYARKSPLQQQLEYIRVRKELDELLGTSSPAVRGDAFELDPLPDTPTALSEELGYRDGGRAVRRLLQQRDPDHKRRTIWPPLTVEQVNYVRAHLPSRSQS